MKVLQFAISLLIIVDLYDSISARADENLDDTMMIKRPFCNAFTGCGKKRDSLNTMPAGGSGYQLPIPVYRALLRIVAAAARNNVDNVNDRNDLRMRLRTAAAEEAEGDQSQMPPRLRLTSF